MKKKIVSILLIILILFSFTISVFASSSSYIDYSNYDYLYSYNLHSFDFGGYDSPAKKFLDKAQSDVRVSSGDYYYFITCNGVNTTNGTLYSLKYGLYLIKKSAIFNNDIKLLFCNWSDTHYSERVAPYRYMEGCRLGLSSSDLKNTGDLIIVEGDTFYDYNAENSGLYGITLTMFYNESQKSFECPFLTNFDGDIYRSCADGSRKYLNYKQPYIANTQEQLQNFNASCCVVTYGVPASDCFLSLRESETNNILFDVCLTDYQDYKQRIDESNPFSVLGFVIPWYDLGKFSVVKNVNYELRLTYTTFNNTTNVSKFFNSLVDLNVSDVKPDNPDKPDTPTTPDYSKDFENLGTKIEDSNKETQNALKEQTEAINNQTEELKEQNKTSKNIFQKIGEMLSYINPFSDNFFGKKLVELILNGLKSLFVPEEGFFSDYFNELRDWFSDRLGFLWAPFDFIIEVLDRIANINFSEPIIDIPEIKEPFTNKTLISSTKFNFNSLLENETLKNVHDIYLFGVDFIICLGLYNLAKNKMEGVFKN